MRDETWRVIKKRFGLCEAERAAYEAALAEKLRTDQQPAESLTMEYMEERPADVERRKGMDTEKEFLTVPEAALLIGKTERAIWQDIYRGRIPYKRWGRRILFSSIELRDFFAALPGVSVKEAVHEVEMRAERAESERSG